LNIPAAADLTFELELNANFRLREPGAGETFLQCTYTGIDEITTLESMTLSYSSSTFPDEVWLLRNTYWDKYSLNVTDTNFDVGFNLGGEGGSFRVLDRFSSATVLEATSTTFDLSGTLEVDTITNKAGTGAPNATYGIAGIIIEDTIGSGATGYPLVADAAGDPTYVATSVIELVDLNSKTNGTNASATQVPIANGSGGITWGAAGTSFIPGLLTPKLGGSGADGVGPATTGNLDTGNLKQYSSWTINAGETITLTNAGGVSRVTVSGNCTINGTLTATGKSPITVSLGSASGSASEHQTRVPPISTSATATLWDLDGNCTDLRLGGGGGGGARLTSGTSGNGANTRIISFGGNGRANTFGAGRANDGVGAAAAAPTNLSNLRLYAANASWYMLGLCPGGPGGGGGCGILSGAADGTGSNGGLGGGVIVLEVGGTLTIGAAGVVAANGNAGSNGGAGASVGGGGGGGGAGGRILLRAPTIANSGSVTVAGGAAGAAGTGVTYAGGAGAAGETGLSLVEVVQ
jgi:hypothetical protein